MASLFRRMVQVLLVAALPLVPAAVRAQEPAPPPAQEPAPPDPAQDPAPLPDDGPKPAGVGSSQPPPPEEQPQDDDQEPDALEPTSFPGVPLSGVAPSSRPFSGLFRGAAPFGRGPHTLSLSGSVYGAYSSNIAPESFGGDPSAVTGQGSLLAGGSGSLNYNRTWRKATVSAFADGSRSWLEAYRGLRDPWLTYWTVGTRAGFSKALGRRTQFGASGSVGYSPYLNFGGFDLSRGNVGTIPSTPAGLDTVVARDPSIRTTGMLSLSHALNRKSSMEFYYTANVQTFVSSDPLNDDRLDQTAGGRYRYRFSRFVGVYAGYGYRHASYGGVGTNPYTNHFLDLGVDAGYGRSYALTRRTTFSFSTNSSVFQEETIVPGENGQGRSRTHFFVGGNADLTHAMGRSWAARTGYRRGVSYDIGFDQPLLSDAVHASVDGLVGPRLDFVANAVYTAGKVGFSGPDRGYDTATANARLRLAISSKLAAYVQYFYYHYSFQQGVALPGFLQPSLDRQGVSVGLTAFLPVIGSRGRR